MSGGVDSSVAAALLKKQGYDVIGVFMKFWSEERIGLSTTLEVKENICCSLEAATAARSVANKLKIPFYVLNFEKEFKKAVVDYYISEYENCRTPNPCVICNRDIKGEVLLKKVLELKADYLATGHYARLGREARNSKHEIRNYKLLQAKDKTKDQTYFLWTLTQEKLSKMLFPIGDYTKTEVRQLAKKMQLPTATRRESQGICFIPDRNVAGFLTRHAKKFTKPGEIVDTKDKKLGIHLGLVNYTIGQREGLGLGGPKAYYVVKLDSRNNRLVVGDEKDLYRKKLLVKDLNWIGETFENSLQCSARIRHNHPIDECVLTKKGKRIEVTFKKPQRAITPGQSIVFYQDEKVLGGGIIQNIRN